MTPIRILLVDDNRDFLGSAVNFLAVDPRLKIVGTVTSGREALELTPGLQPDLVLMDLAMPEMNGLEATRRLKARSTALRVVIVTGNDHQEYRNAANAAGADGFLAKSDFGRRAADLIHTLCPTRQTSCQCEMP
jgi:DNA-binding NarL/FixJ family response regulator